MMAVPTSFDGENGVLNAAPGDEHAVDALNVYQGPLSCGHLATISCWKLEKHEVDELLKTGRIWLYVMGSHHPPVIVSATNPFGRGNDGA